MAKDENQAEPAARIESLRRMALAQIASPQPRYNARAVVIELGEIGEIPGIAALPAFLEATVLAAVARGKRPRRAQKSLYRLFRARIAAGEHAEFQRFEQALRYAVHDESQLEGLYFHSAFATMDQNAIWRDIEAVLGRLSGTGGEAFLNSGTLLGAVRDKSLIAHDDDVDLAFRLEAASQEEAARQWQNTREILREAGLLSPFQPSNPGTLKLKSEGSYNIDLFPAWLSEGRVFVYPHTCGDLAEDQVFPLATCETTGLPIPKDAPAMLEVNYGPGWSTPDPGFAFDWGKANARFAPFRKELDRLQEKG